MSDKDLLNVDKSYCISLKTNDTKWDILLNSIHKNGFPSCEIFEGIPGISFKDTDVSNVLSVWQEYILKFAKERHNHEHFNTWGGLGCYMSHTTIWKEAVDKGYKRIAIFEDDVYFDPKFKERLNESMKNVPKDSQLILFDSKKLESKPVFDDKKKQTNVSKIQRFFGLHAYVIDRACMKILLSRVFPIELQIDSYISFMISFYNLKVYDIAGLCGQSFHMSSIQTTCQKCPSIGSMRNDKRRLAGNIIISLITIVLIVVVAIK